MHDEIRVNAALDPHWSACWQVRDLGLELLAVGCTDPC
jgi:hypothetical protein